MNTFARCTTFALLLLPLPLAAQATPLPDDASKRVHAAWVLEVLDLDVRGAVAEYQAIAHDQPSAQRQAQPVRWIAIARLAELQRAGVPVEPKPSFADAPAALQEAFATLTPIPVAELLRRASGDPAALVDAADTDAGVPTLRPATGQVQEWVRGQGMSSTDRARIRRSIDLLNQGPRRGNPDRTPTWAADIVDVELRGAHELAANRRSLYFPLFKPVPPSGDPAAALARVRANLDAWSKEQELSPFRRSLLQRLRAEIDQRATTDPAAAVAFVARLPVYGERLLLQEPPK